MRIPICNRCDEIIPLDLDVKVESWAVRKQCDDCRETGKAERFAARRDAYIEDVEWLISTGRCWAEISTRLNTTPAGIARRLYRYGRPDLAGWFERTVWSVRTEREAS